MGSVHRHGLPRQGAHGCNGLGHGMVGEAENHRLRGVGGKLGEAACGRNAGGVGQGAGMVGVAAGHHGHMPGEGVRQMAGHVAAADDGCAEGLHHSAS